jgi:hypothetical protein
LAIFEALYTVIPEFSEKFEPFAPEKLLDPVLLAQLKFWFTDALNEGRRWALASTAWRPNLWLEISLFLI